MIRPINLPKTNASSSRDFVGCFFVLLTLKLCFILDKKKTKNIFKTRSAILSANQASITFLSIILYDLIATERALYTFSFFHLLFFFLSFIFSFFLLLCFFLSIYLPFFQIQSVNDVVNHEWNISNKNFKSLRKKIIFSIL